MVDSSGPSVDEIRSIRPLADMSVFRVGNTPSLLD